MTTTRQLSEANFVTRKLSQRAAKQRLEPSPRWEYAMVTYSEEQSIASFVTSHYPEATTSIPVTFKDHFWEMDIVAFMVNQGWGVITTTRQGNAYRLYFKRPQLPVGMKEGSL
jgi:hypothetical protein